jgi:hypothetical protein
LKDEALDRTMWRARFGRGFGPVVRQTTKWMNESWHLCFGTKQYTVPAKCDSNTKNKRCFYTLFICLLQLDCHPVAVAQYSTYFHTNNTQNNTDNN